MKFLIYLLCVLGVLGANAQSINIVSPNGGESWQVGSSQTITWTSSGTSGSVNIEFTMDNGANWTPIVFNTADLGSFAWNVTGFASSQCRVRITDFNIPSTWDQSAGLFTLTPGTPTITLFTPNGGETYAIGAFEPIAWSSANIQNIKIEFSVNNGTNWTTIEASYPASGGSYLWEVPGPQYLNTVKVRLSDASNASVNVVSITPFSIRSPFISFVTPTTGNAYYPGDTVLVQWNALIISDYINMDYRTSPAGPWNPIVSNYFNDEFYFWVAPAVNSTQVQIRITDVSSSGITGSSAYFTIAPPVPDANLQIPNGGEQFAQGFLNNIVWNSIAIQSLDIELSRDSLATWEPVANNVSATQNSYSWLTTGPVSDDCFIRIINHLNGMAMDTSNAAFTINSPAGVINLYSPFGAELWPQGSTQVIQWGTQFINNINIELSTDNGNSYSNVASNVPANQNFYLWQVSGPISSQCFIRISDAANASNFAVNNIAFSIIGNSITLTAPNGGELLNPGSVFYISWNSAISSDSIGLEYTTDNGANWLSIETSVLNLSYYNWTIPNTPSAQCKIRVFEAGNPGLSDASDNTFTILQPVPSVTLVYPAGGEVLTAGTIYNIEWTSLNAAAVDLEFSADSGQSWTPIASSLNASNLVYSWMVPAQATTNALVRIKVAGMPSAADTSAGVFTIVVPPQGLQLITPFNGQTLGVLNQFNITWNSSLVNAIDILFSYNNGLNWLPVATNVPAINGQFTWQVPMTLTQYGRIRIHDSSNPSLSSGNLLPFSIVSPTITVNYPIGGESFGIFSDVTVLWNSSYLSGNVSIEYSPDNGINWLPVISSTPNNGLFTWNINSLPTNNGLIRVKSVANPGVSDVCNAAFHVVSNGPAVHLVTPVTGQVLGAGSTCLVEWNAYQVNNVRLEYSTDGGNSWQNIALLLPAQSLSFLWQVPVINATNVKVRVLNASNLLLTDEHSGITIVTPEIEVVSPNGGEFYNLSSPIAIEWTSNGAGNYVNIDFTTNGINYQPIVSGVLNSGTYNWALPSVISSTLKIRVSDMLDSTVADESNAAFSVTGSPTISLQNIPGSWVVTTGDVVQIGFTTQAVPLVKAEYSIDGGNNWIIINNNITGAAGSFLWNVPLTPAVNCRLKLSDASNALIYDESVDFTIAGPFIQINSPNGGENLSLNMPTYISWSHSGIDFVDLWYSTNGGTTWSVLDTGVFNTGTYIWTPSMAGNNYRIKVGDADGLYAPDSSNAVFTVSTSVPALVLTSPAGGEQLIAGSQHQITWTSSGVTQIKIEVSYNSGSSWSLVTAAHAAIPSVFTWIVPNNVSSGCRIKISALTGGLSSSSAGDFSILSAQPSIQVLTPNGGEIFETGSFHTITWNAVNVPFVNIYYSENNGAVWNYIQTLSGNVQQYYWEVPSLPSNQYRIKVAHGNLPFINDLSDASFSVIISSYTNQLITIDTISDHQLCPGEAFTVSYSAVGAFTPGNIMEVQLSDSSGSFLSPIAIGSSSSTGSGQINCVVPQQVFVSSHYHIRVVASLPGMSGTVYTYPLTVNYAQIDFIANQQLCLLPAGAVSFTPTGNTGLVSSFNWSFGDGSSSTLTAPTHTYAMQGNYTVSLQTTDNYSCQRTLSKIGFIQCEAVFPSFSTGLQSTGDLRSVYMNADGSIFCIDQSGKCYVSQDSGTTWALKYIPADSTDVFFGSSSSSDKWFAAADNGKIFYSQDEGTTWNVFSLGTTAAIRDVHFDQNNNGYAVGSYGRIFVWYNNGWIPKSSPLTSDLNAISNMNHRWMAVGENGRIIKLVGNNWVSESIPGASGLNDVAFSDTSNIYIAADNGFIYKSVDGGLLWNVTLAGAGVNFNTIVSYHDSVWAAGDNGIIYFSPDGGTIWHRYSCGTTDRLNDLAFQYPIGYVAGDNGFIRRFEEVFYQPAEPSGTTINGNTISGIIVYPNPVDEWLNIRVPADYTPKTIIVEVFDVAGKPVTQALLFSGKQQFSVPFSGMLHGTYFVRIKSNEGEKTVKVIK